MVERKWTSTLGELIDRMTIVGLKIAYNKDLREQYGKEMEDLIHDVNLVLTSKVNKEVLNAEFIKFIILLAQYNGMIWHNESAQRGDGEGNDLYKTHIFNGIRCRLKDKVSTYSKERIDPKIDSLGAIKSEWEPIW
jgi:hypothetical protein